MARQRVRANVSGGAGGSRWARRAEVKDDARFTRRVEDREAIDEALLQPTIEPASAPTPNPPGSDSEVVS